MRVVSTAKRAAGVYKASPCVQHRSGPRRMKEQGRAAFTDLKSWIHSISNYRIIESICACRSLHPPHSLTFGAGTGFNRAAPETNQHEIIIHPITSTIDWLDQSNQWSRTKLNENQKILSCISAKNWSCSLHLKSISIHGHNSVNVSRQLMESENKEKGPRSRVSPPPTAEPHLPSVEPFPEMKNRFCPTRRAKVTQQGSGYIRPQELIKNSSPTVGPTTPPLHCFTRPNK
jgi:hypothetical protein